VQPTEGVYQVHPLAGEGLCQPAGGAGVGRDSGVPAGKQRRRVNHLGKIFVRIAERMNQHPQSRMADICQRRQYELHRSIL